MQIINLEQKRPIRRANMQSFVGLGAFQYIIFSDRHAMHQRYMKWSTVVSMQSRFDTNWSQFETSLKSIW